jgi:hypothetical protein
MADEKKQVKKEYNLLEDSFRLSSQVTSTGYNSTIDGRKFVIDFVKDFNGYRVSQFASLCSLQDTPAGKLWIPISPAKYEVDGLTKQQLFELATAQAIELNDEQRKEFIRMFHPRLVKFMEKKQAQYDA